MSNLSEIRALTWVDLAGYADCFTPDSADSAGAAFLTSVRDALVERVEYVRADNADMDWSTLVEHMEDDVHELADDAPDVYTATRWAEFVDLGAYQEDLSELGEVDPDDLTRSVAGVCLYIIAERLIRALLAELAEQDEDDDEEPRPGFTPADLGIPEVYGN